MQPQSGPPGRVPTLARNALGPLLEELMVQLEAEGRATQHACFRRIKRSLDGAADDTGLAASLMALASTEAVGFARSHATQALLLRLLEKADSLADILSRQPDRTH